MTNTNFIDLGFFLFLNKTLHKYFTLTIQPIRFSATGTNFNDAYYVLYDFFEKRLESFEKTTIA